MNLGKLRLATKNFESAIEPLTQAVTAKPTSAEANYFLGEAYLQIKKGSKAVGYLNEALRLDPIGMAEVHLWLALLYNGAGMKDKAASEYEQFLRNDQTTRTKRSSKNTSRTIRNHSRAIKLKLLRVSSPSRLRVSLEAPATRLSLTTPPCDRKDQGRRATTRTTTINTRFIVFSGKIRMVALRALDYETTRAGARFLESSKHESEVKLHGYGFLLSAMYFSSFFLSE